MSDLDPFIGEAPIPFATAHLSVSTAAGPYISFINGGAVAHVLTLSFRNVPAGTTPLSTPLGVGSGVCFPSAMIAEVALEAADAVTFALYTHFPLSFGPATLTVQGTINVGSTNGQAIPNRQVKSGGNTTIASCSAAGILVCLVSASGTALPTFNINAIGAQNYPPTEGPSMTAVVASTLYLYKVAVGATDSVVVANGVFQGNVLIVGGG